MEFRVFIAGQRKRSKKTKSAWWTIYTCDGAAN